MKKSSFFVMSLFLFSHCDCFSMVATRSSKCPPPPVGWAEHNPLVRHGQSTQVINLPEEQREQEKTNSFKGSYITPRGTIYAPIHECDFTPEQIVEKIGKLGYTNIHDTGILPKIIAYILWCIEKTDIKEAFERKVPRWLYIFLRLTVYDHRYDFFQYATFRGDELFCPVPNLIFSKDTLALFINEVTQLSSPNDATFPITGEHAQAFYDKLVVFKSPSLKAARTEGQKPSTPNTTQISTLPNTDKPNPASNHSAEFGLWWSPSKKR